MIISPNDISSQFLPDYNFDLLLTLQNIWTEVYFHILIAFALREFYFKFYVLEYSLSTRMLNAPVSSFAQQYSESYMDIFHELRRPTEACVYSWCLSTRPDACGSCYTFHVIPWTISPHVLTWKWDFRFTQSCWRHMLIMYMYVSTTVPDCLLWPHFLTCQTIPNMYPYHNFFLKYVAFCVQFPMYYYFPIRSEM